LPKISLKLLDCIHKNIFKHNTVTGLILKTEPGPSPNPAQARHFFEAQFRPESQIYWVNQDMRNWGVQCRLRVYLPVHGFIKPKIATTLTKPLAYTSTNLAC